MRAVDRPGHEQLSKDLEVALDSLDGVHWAQVNPWLGRVVVVFDPEGPSVDDLVEVVEGIEASHDVGDKRFPHDRPEHPGDFEPLRRDTIALGADVVGLGASVFGQLIRATPFPVELAALVSLIDHEPRLRGFLEHHVGPPVTDLGLGLSNAFVQTLSQGPLGLVVDIGHRANLIRESQERRHSWERRELELDPCVVDNPPRPLAPVERPTPLPGGPLERYADRATLASLAVFGTAFAVTGSPRRAASFIVAGVPKAGRMGREAFAASFGRELARREVVVLDRAVLRRLDRVDLVLIDADVVTRRSVLGRIASIGAAPQELSDQAARLFDEAAPGRVVRRGPWTLGPLKALEDAGARLSTDAVEKAAALRRGDGMVLGFEHRGEVVGLATAERELHPIAEALIATARRGGLTVALGGGDPGLAELLGVEHLVPGGRDLAASVRRLQLEGHGVLLVSHDAEGLRAADCGVGITGRVVPWGADLLTKEGLTDAHLVVEAVGTARAVSTRSAILALAGSGIGAVWSLVGPAGSAGRRAALPVNAAALAAQSQAMASVKVLHHRPGPVPRWHTAWHAMDGPAVLLELATAAKGLSAEQAAARRTTGRSAPPPVLLRVPKAIAAELANPLTPVLGVGAGLAAAVGSVTDAGLVAGVMGVNAVIGGVQRVRAEVSIERLVEVSSTLVNVRRAGELAPVGREDLVRGDVIRLSAGDVVPADCRILETEACEVDESVLTGESLPVAKHPTAVPGAAVAERHCMLYEGTTLSTGWAEAVVVAVGSETEVGQSLLDAPDPPPSGVEARLSTLTAVTVPVTLASGAAVTAMTLLRGRSPRRAISSGVSLMVAAVPEGLPLVASVAQLAAARRLSDQGALVRNPRTIEALGRVDTLCFDKTGTLTLGEISLQWVSDGSSDERIGDLGPESKAVLAAALRASPATNPDPALVPHATDRAVLVGAQTAGVSAEDGLGGWEALGELAFDPARGYHAVVGASPAGARVSVKGAPEVIVPRCTSWIGPDGRMPLAPSVLRQLEVEVERLAERGLRVLAVAERSASNRSEVGDDRVSEMDLLGFLGLADSVRPTASAAVADLRTAGIDVVMITGDHPSTARAIGAELGIVNGHRVVTGAEVDAMSDAQLDAALPEISVFARVTPTNKVRVVRAYQRLGRVVAMTGDGANDAPAIRLANAGIALGDRGSPAAREAADLVVVDDRIETILGAIVEGRGLWMSVRDALAILVGGNLGEVAFTLAATAIAGDSPLGARQLLLVNLMTDMLPAMTIAMRPPANQSPEMLLHEGPDASLGSALVHQIALRATTTAGGTLAAWLVARSTGTRRRASTVALVALVGTQLGQTAAVGGTSPLVLASSAVSAAALVAIVQTPIVSQFFGCTPLGPFGWGISAGAAATATGVAVVAPRALGRLRRWQDVDRPDGWDLGSSLNGHLRPVQ